MESLAGFSLANNLTRIESNSLGALQKALVLSEVPNELSTITLFVERECGDVEFDSIRVFVFLFDTQLNVNLTISPVVLVFAFFLISCIIEGSIAGEESGS